MLDDRATAAARVTPSQSGNRQGAKNAKASATTTPTQIIPFLWLSAARLPIGPSRARRPRRAMGAMPWRLGVLAVERDTQLLRQAMEPSPAIDALARQVVDAAYQVHVTLGPGLLESVYEACLAMEFSDRGITFKRQCTLPIFYKSRPIDATLRLDFLVADSLVVEAKSVERLLPLHEAQLLTYLKLSGRPLGLLINFNVVLIKDGIRRMVFMPSNSV